MERNMMRTRKTTWTRMLLKITGLKMLQMMNLPRRILNTRSHKPPRVHVINHLFTPCIHSFIHSIPDTKSGFCERCLWFVSWEISWLCHYQGLGSWSDWLRQFHRVCQITIKAFFVSWTYNQFAKRTKENPLFQQKLLLLCSLSLSIFYSFLSLFVLDLTQQCFVCCCRSTWSIHCSLWARLGWRCWTSPEGGESDATKENVGKWSNTPCIVLCGTWDVCDLQIFSGAPSRRIPKALDSSQHFFAFQSSSLSQIWKSGLRINFICLVSEL